MRKPCLGLLLCLVTAIPAAAQGTIQQPGPIQKPGEIQQPKGTIQTPGEIKAPRGTWQTPGEIQVPRGTWQVPGEIQVPKGIQAVKSIESSACERRLSVVGDALFDFDKSGLRADAEETLSAALPEIRKLGGKPARVEGHTDAIGSDSYNQKLSEARAKIVRDWLAQRGAIPGATAIAGFGKTKPVAANATEDGKDYPQGRQQNRRVEVVFDSCR